VIVNRLQAIWFARGRTQAEGDTATEGNGGEDTHSKPWLVGTTPEIEQLRPRSPRKAAGGGEQGAVETTQEDEQGAVETTQEDEAPGAGDKPDDAWSMNV
jgi:hypothetical protein